MKYFINSARQGLANVYVEASKPKGIPIHASPVAPTPGNAVLRWLNEVSPRAKIRIEKESQIGYGRWEVEYSVR